MNHNLRHYLDKHLRPDNQAIALKVAGKAITYGQLYHKVIGAVQVIKAQAPNASRIGIFAYRSEFSYVATLAAVYRDATFVYLNPTFPQERLAKIMNSAELDLVMVDGSKHEQYESLSRDLSVPPKVLLEEAAGKTENLRAQLPLPKSQAQASDIAYIMYTSGSTGIPKSVPITQENLCSFLEYNHERYQITPEDNLSQIFDQSFDLSIFDIFMAFTSGATLCIPSSLDLLAPFKYLNNHKVTVWFSTPSLANMLAKRGFLKENSLSSLRLSLFCGEALPKKTAILWAEAAPNSVLENLYGPTEATIACFFYQWSKEHSPDECLNEIVPIGTPYPHLDAALLDEDDQLIEGADQMGELLFAGNQVFSGYLNNTEQNEKVLIQVDDSGKVYYRSGDLASRTSSGVYNFHGRRDSQVKVNGYRIELGEIESVARKLGFLDVAAVTLPPGPIAEQIVFFHKDDKSDVDLSKHFEEKLPRYMFPKAIHCLDSIPLNVNGKIDRNQLTQIAQDKVTNEL